MSVHVWTPLQFCSPSTVSWQPAWRQQAADLTPESPDSGLSSLWCSLWAPQGTKQTLKTANQSRWWFFIRASVKQETDQALPLLHFFLQFDNLSCWEMKVSSWCLTTTSKYWKRLSIFLSNIGLLTSIPHFWDSWPFEVHENVSCVQNLSLSARL